MDAFRHVFYPIEEGVEERLRVQLIGFHWTVADVFSLPHGRPAYWFFLFHDAMQLLGRDGCRPAPPFTFVIYGPGEAQRFGLEGAWSHSWIRAVGKGIPEWLEENGLTTSVPIVLGSSALSDIWLPRLNEELLHPDGADSVIVENLFRIWLREVRRVALANAEAPPPNPGLARARRYIDENFRDVLTLEQLADIAALSPAHFCHSFRLRFGVSPLQYAIRLRLQHAAYLLEDQTLTIAEIAADSGYDDVCYFSKLFKKHMGSSPGRYRGQISTMGKR